MRTAAAIHRRFRRAYVAGLSLIAVCATVAYGVQYYSMNTINADASTINVSGQQRALSQRAALLIAAAYNAESTAERNHTIDELEAVLGDMTATHNALIEGDETLGLAGDPSAEVRALLFESPVHLDKVFELFTTQTEAVIAGLRAGTADPVAVRAASRLARQELTQAFHLVVGQYQIEADARVARMHFELAMVLACTLALLIIEALFIFRPAARAIELQARDIIDSKQQLEHATAHDALTGLPNRRICRERTAGAIAEARATTGLVTMLHLDLNGFKEINDAYGHAAGDDALWQVADRLRHAAEESDVVARVAGDEFVIVCSGAHRARDASTFADRFMSCFSEPIELLDNTRVEISCTMGLASYPIDADNVDDLMIAANMALQAAKKEGRNRHAIFDRSMREAFLTNVKTSRRIKTAVDNEEFEVFYQPQIEFATGRVAGVEALIRWRDPDLGLRTPGDFLEAVERSDSFGKIAAFVIDRAIRDAARWHREGLEFGRIGLNITAEQLQDSTFIDSLLDRLFAHGLPPRKLAIEILEGAVLSSNNRRLRALLDEFNDLDINVEFDDFGTGYASLMHLRELPVNRIKIDRSFVNDLPSNYDHANIVRGVINIVRELGLELVAEGVETVQQARLLSAWGCPCAQGFLFARPKPFEETSAYLRLAEYKRSLASVSQSEEADAVCDAATGEARRTVAS